MKKKLINTFLISTVSTMLMVNSTQAETKFRNIYRCINNQGKPTTVVDTQRGRIQLIVWQSDFFASSNWTPQNRCQVVTQRFQRFSDYGTLRFISYGVLNNYPIICIAENRPGQGLACKKDGLLITLQPNDNPKKVMQDLFDKNRLSDGKSPITRGKVFFINFDNFLEKATITND